MLLSSKLPDPSASEVTTLWRYTSMSIIIIIILIIKCYTKGCVHVFDVDVLLRLGVGLLGLRVAELGHRQRSGRRHDRSGQQVLRRRLHATHSVATQTSFT